MSSDSEHDNSSDEEYNNIAKDINVNEKKRQMENDEESIHKNKKIKVNTDNDNIEKTKHSKKMKTMGEDKQKSAAAEASSEKITLEKPKKMLSDDQKEKMAMGRKKHFAQKSTKESLVSDERNEKIKILQNILDGEKDEAEKNKELAKYINDIMNAYKSDTSIDIRVHYEKMQQIIDSGMEKEVIKYSLGEFLSRAAIIDSFQKKVIQEFGLNKIYKNLNSGMGHKDWRTPRAKKQVTKESTQE